MDRLVSASSGDDALRCLQDLQDASVSMEVVLDHPDCLVHILHLLQSREFKSTRTSLATSDEATILHAILKLYQGWASNSQCLLQPEPGRLLEALLDVVDVSHGEVDTSTSSTMRLPTYVRVLALQLLHQLLQQHGTLAVEQWLQAPNGLHRLLEQLWVGTANVSSSSSSSEGDARALDEEEAVRVQALEVAQVLAQKSPAIAKIFLFDEVESQLLDVFWRVYGGLTRGHGFVADGLTLIHTCLLHQASDSSLLDLIWQRPTVPMRLAQLLDLRGGHAFLNPDEYVPPKVQKAKNSNKSTTTSKSPKLGPLSRRNKPRPNEQDNDDDLDSLLQSATTPQKAASSSRPDTTTTTAAPGTAALNTRAEYPHLLESEEIVISRVLQIIDVLLEPHELREQVWTKYAPALTTFCWELALIVPPPPGAPAYFALPSSLLQRTALQLVATKMASPKIMDQMNGLDRLLNVVCTGGGLATSLQDRMGCSQAALHVMRKILEPTRIHTLLLHTLAPPPLPDQEEEALPPSPTVVQKLWNTVAEHLDPTLATVTDGQLNPDTDSRTIFVSGALGALAVFCVDAESREMLVQSTPPPASIEQMLEILSQQQQQQETVDETSTVSGTSTGGPSLRQVRIYALYRFLLQYIYETPALVQAVLSSPASIHLATLATTPSTFQPLTLLLLGLCLEFFPSASSECGGWTTASLLQVFQGMSIPKATKLMQGFLLDKGSDRTRHNNMTASVGGSFLVCELESSHWQDWYQQALWTVRKRLVKELAGHGGSSLEEDEDDDKDVVKDATQKIKPLQIMIAQQSTELEELHLQLEQANAKMKIQESQLETWERRMRSNPTQLDGILNELTQKAATLEGEIARLESQAEKTAEQHRKDLTTVTEQLQEQRDDASRLRVSTQEALEDRDRMEQELSALSQAYSNLEDEFRRSASASVDASMRTSSSTEVMTLRAENDRLKASVKDADEWMAQAYQKMAELGTQNGSLKGEVLSLTEQLTRTATTYESNVRKEMDMMSQQNLNLQGQLTLLQGQLQGSQSEVSSLQEQLQQAATSHEQWQEAYAALEQQSRLALEEQVGLSARDSAHMARIEELEGHVEARSQEIISLQALLHGARPSVDSSTKSDINEMQSKLEAARREVESVRTRSEEEIYKRESVIRELESRLGAGLGTYTIKDIRSRDQEIEELRAANEAAQEWMGKAVEQHRILQEKLWAAAKSSNSSTYADDSSAILALKEAIALEEARHEETRLLVHDLEKKLDEETKENDDLRKELSLASEKSQGKALNLTS